MNCSLEQHHLSLDLTSASAILPPATILVVAILMGHQGVWIIRDFKPTPILNNPHAHQPRGLGVGPPPILMGQGLFVKFVIGLVIVLSPL
jgi:hypothetical protein